ncbi:MAG TPA: FHA domain-containing protein [Acidiferrobacteraceae bacterium]|nr:FHA domain-containing protein [Acidiferrobacteraceae bacterium]
MTQSRVTLQPMTPEAEQAAGARSIPINHLPFRIGREARLGIHKGNLEIMERRKLDHSPNNDIYLVDSGKPLNISREHFLIDQDGNGGYKLVDRGSACGTQVGNDSVGGRDQGGACPLLPGTVIIVGIPNSPYIYKFTIEE